MNLPPAAHLAAPTLPSPPLGGVAVPPSCRAARRPVASWRYPLSFPRARMGHPAPAPLARLLAAADGGARERAWAELLSAQSRLLLHVCRSLGGDHDAVMDRYTEVVERLRQNDFKRLRAFVADGRSEFSTWLVVVAQRICVDHHRHRYGRSHGPRVGASAPDDDELAVRRRLVDLVAAEVDLDPLRDDRRPEASDAVTLADARATLDAALALLDPADRLLIKLRFEDALPMPEIARHLRLPTRFHAYRRLARVLQRLRHALERSGARDMIA